MHVICPACSARYTTDEDKLRGKAARMRCRACNTPWLVSGPEAAAAVESDAIAAVVKRGADREKRDLFAPQSCDPGSVEQTLHPAPPVDETIPARVASLEARGETSVLFTLAGLTGAARIRTPEPEKTPMAIASTGVEDDEGIIDLKALASSPPKAGVRPVPPLFSEPAAFALDADASGPTSVAPASSRKRLFTVALAIAAVVVAGVGIAFVFGGEKPVRVAAASAPLQPPPAVVIAPPSPQLEPAPAATASIETEIKAATAGKGVKGGKGASAAKGGAKAASSPKPAAAPKAADPCGCKGDFNCVLACTVKKGK